MIPRTTSLLQNAGEVGAYGPSDRSLDAALRVILRSAPGREQAPPHQRPSRSETSRRSTADRAPGASSRFRSVLTGIGVVTLLASCTGEEDQGRPGFPRTPRTPIASAPFPYATPEEVGLTADRIWWFKERLYSRVLARHLVGAEVLVIKDRRIVLHQAMGWSDRERRIPLERNAIVRIASMSKPFAGTAILMLADEGTLALDDRVAVHLPSFDNERSDRITVRQLLTNRSGFVQGGHPPGYREQPTLRGAIDLLGEAGPTFPPGDRFIYSNLNTETLGALVEAVSGQPVDRFIESRILSPIAMEDTHTRFSPDSSWASRVASSYRRWGRAPWERYWSPMRGDEHAWFSPAGDLFSTAFDYARFLTLWMDGGQSGGRRLLDAATVSAALADPIGGPGAPRSRYYAMQWEVYAPPSAPGALPVFGHRGATGTLGIAFPERDAIVLFLTQSQETDVVEEVLAASLEWFGN